MRLVLHPEARAELRSAALWYEERRDGLGGEFVAVIEETLERIGENPNLFPCWLDKELAIPAVHKASVGQFPYAVAYEQHEFYTLVLAIAHQKRRPFYWLKRLGQRTS